MLTMSPGRRVGARHCRTYSTKMTAFIGRSMTKGATMPSCRSAATKVTVFQCPQGTRPMTLRPRLARPRSRAMLVQVPVSSMKTKRAGSNDCRSICHWARAKATSGRSCSAASTVFFNGDVLALKEAPDRAVAYDHASVLQLRTKLFQGEIGHRRDPLQDPVTLATQRRAMVASHRLGRNTAGL